MKGASLEARRKHWLSDEAGRLRKPRLAIVLAVAYVVFSVGLGVVAVGISISTLFVKQHYIVDSERLERR